MEIAAPPEVVYAIVAAVDRVPELSPECRRIEWLSDVRQPVAGARFRGRNRWRGFAWWREVVITMAAPGKEFCFETVPGRGMYHDSTAWRYAFERTETGTRVTESYEFRAPRWILRMDRMLGRPRALAQGMNATLTSLKAAAERQGTVSRS